MFGYKLTFHFPGYEEVKINGYVSAVSEETAVKKFIRDSENFIGVIFDKVELWGEYVNAKSK